MSELKTLKDFQRSCGSDHCSNCISRKELKQEAIKWVKSDSTMNHRHWICNLHNITEGDLK